MPPTPSINLRRRQLLIAAGAAALGAVACTRRESDGELLLAACDDAQGRHFLAAIEADGRLRFRLPVPARGHAIVLLPDGRRALYFGRRPGRQSWLVDIDAGRLLQTIDAAPGRHFYGHGAIGRDGLLYTSENDYAAARGVIGAWDLRDGCRRLGEFDSGGTGPHELAFLADGRTLAVANGGIETHPDRDREKLNLPTMRPSLAYVDVASRRVLARHEPDDHRMSLRHLAVAPDDTVIVGVQYEGESGALVPLLFAQRGDGPLRPARADAAAWRSHANYIASVGVSRDGRYALLTAPRGATASLWQLDTLTLAARWQVRDVAGVAAAADSGFLLSSGFGQLLQADLTQAPARRPVDESLRWDNHLLAV